MLLGSLRPFSLDLYLTLNLEPEPVYFQVGSSQKLGCLKHLLTIPIYLVTMTVYGYISCTWTIVLIS